MPTVTGPHHRIPVSRLTAAWLGILLFAHAIGSPTLSAADIVTTRTDPVGTLLNEWFAAGSAAGLAHLQYENRDHAHSPLPAGLYPQLTLYQATEEEKAQKKDVALMDVVRDLPTIGNCSMAAPVESGGSLPRHYQLLPPGNLFLARQYLQNQLYVYPEHFDHDPGFNGIGGYGDLFVLNTPALLISQGSSFTDMPFVQALLATAAAFPPDTQRLLISKRLLSPTLQSIFRHANRQVKTDADYYTGTAHPPVFDSSQIDEEKMIGAAHAMLPAAIPPVALLRVLEETPWTPGQHYFEADPAPAYKVSDSPVSIARIFRGNTDTYDIIVSAEKSVEVSGRPIQLRWHLLQGDPRTVRMELGKGGTIAKIRVRWSPPTFPAPGLQSHRIDIGVFASNGLNVSAPAIISIYMLPNEVHFYDDQGHLTEIYYQAHNPHLGLPLTDTDPRWLDVLLAFSLRAEPLTTTLIQQLIGTAGQDALQHHWETLDPHLQKLRHHEAAPQSQEATTAARTTFQKALATALAEPIPAGKQPLPLKSALHALLNALADTTDLYPQFQDQLSALALRSPAPDAAGHLRRQLDRLKKIGILIETDQGRVQIAKSPEQRTPADRYYLRGLNLTLLSHVLFPTALTRSPDPAFVDPRLTTPKAWRDVILYDKETGQRKGWLRYMAGQTTHFNDQGQLQPPAPTGPQTVHYQKTPETGLTPIPQK